MSARGGRSFAARQLRRVEMSRLRVVAGATALLAGLVAGLAAARTAIRWARLAGDGARLAYAVATLRLLRRCPDCRRWLRGDASVCWRCGARKGGRRWPRARSRF